MYIEQYAILIIKIEKRQRVNGIRLPNVENIRNFGEKESYKYLKILERDTIK